MRWIFPALWERDRGADGERRNSVERHAFAESWGGSDRQFSKTLWLRGISIIAALIALSRNVNRFCCEGGCCHGNNGKGSVKELLGALRGRAGEEPGIVQHERRGRVRGHGINALNTAEN